MYYKMDSWIRLMQVAFALMLVIGALVIGTSSAYPVSYQNVTSMVTVSEAVAIGLSTNLSAGISFGSLNSGTENNNATYNYNVTGQTLYWVNLSGDSTSNADICVKANESLQI